MLNRKELQEAVIDRTIDGMDLRDLTTFVGDVLADNYDGMSDAEFMDMVAESFPDLLEEN